MGDVRIKHVLSLSLVFKQLFEDFDRFFMRSRLARILNPGIDHSLLDVFAILGVLLRSIGWPVVVGVLVALHAIGSDRGDEISARSGQSGRPFQILVRIFTLEVRSRAAFRELVIVHGRGISDIVADEEQLLDHRLVSLPVIGGRQAKEDRQQDDIHIFI